MAPCRLQSGCSKMVMQQDIHQFRQNMTYSTKFLLPLICATCWSVQMKVFPVMSPYVQLFFVKINFELVLHIEEKNTFHWENVWR